MYLVDEMDIGFYFELLVYANDMKEGTKQGFIDQVLF